MTDKVLAVAQHDIPAIVTHLHIHAPLTWPVPEPPEGMSIDHMPTINAQAYQRLFRLVGEEWLWQGRLRWSDAELASHLAHKDVDVFVLRMAGEPLGFAEMNYRTDPADVAYFGLTRAAIGTGAGYALMGHVLREALARVPTVHVQTCTLDHPAALKFYQKCGFKPIRREIEIMPDPRHNGLLPRDAAPQIPLLSDDCAESL